jgi:hypothetical protein
MKDKTAYALRVVFLRYTAQLASTTGIETDSPEVSYHYDPTKGSRFAIASERIKNIRHKPIVVGRPCVIPCYLDHSDDEIDIFFSAAMAAGDYLTMSLDGQYSDVNFIYRLNDDGHFHMINTDDLPVSGDSNRMAECNYLIHNGLCAHPLFVFKEHAGGYAAAILKAKFCKNRDVTAELGKLADYFKTIVRSTDSQLQRCAELAIALGNASFYFNGASGFRKLFEIAPDNFHAYLNGLYDQLIRSGAHP